MDIKPIETVYNGYRFRSRLEARWAVFFDACELKYHYEPEGFNIGEYYLPDFYLDDLEIYVEIKPFDKSVVSYVGDGNKWEEKCRRFRNITGNAILLCYGEPAEDLCKYLFAWDLTDSGGGSSEWECNFYNHFRKIALITVPTRLDRSIFISETFQRNEYIGTWDDFKGGEFYMPFYDYTRFDRLNVAKTKSRQARFEHGETPMVPTKTSKCPLHEYVFTCEGCKHEHNQQCDYGVEIGWNGDSVIGLYPNYQA